MCVPKFAIVSKCTKDIACHDTPSPADMTINCSSDWKIHTLLLNIDALPFL
jgi:hypothetical protein